MEYFDSVFERWGVRFFKNKMGLTIGLIYNLIVVVMHLYFPLRKLRRSPGRRDNEIYDLHYKRATALNYVDSFRCVCEVFRASSKAFQFDLSKVEKGYALYPGLSNMFSAAGISLKIGKKCLDYSKDLMDTKNYGQLIFYNNCATMLHVCEGSWDQIIEYDEKLIDQSCKVGFLQEVGGYIWGITIVKIEQGRFSEAKALINKLSQIWEVYENAAIRVFQYILEAHLSLKVRKLNDILIKIDEALYFADRSGLAEHQIILLSIKARIQILFKDMVGAKESLLQADKFYRDRKYMLNWFASDYLIAQFVLNIRFLEKSYLSDDTHKLMEYRRKTNRGGRAAKKVLLGKYAVGRTEYFKFMGLYYWLTGKQGMALKWWSRSIAEGEHLNARVELSRTCMEIGKRLTDPNSKYKKLNGISAEEYLSKAETIFKEIGLQYDLDEFDRMQAYR
jgi:hypothetical protein